MSEQPTLFDAQPADPWGSAPDPWAATPAPRRSSPKRPAWLTVACRKNNPCGLKPVRCVCGAWTVQSQPRHNVWDIYDPYIVTGSQVACARILSIVLDRFEWDPDRQAVYLTSQAVYDETLDYLQQHCCGRPPLSDMEPTLKRRRRKRQPVSFPYAGSTDEDIVKFERIWYAPVDTLTSVMG